MRPRRRAGATASHLEKHTSGAGPRKGTRRGASCEALSVDALLASLQWLPLNLRQKGANGLTTPPARVVVSAQASGIAATPGSSLPSRNSREAPPPVETQEIR